MAIIKEHKVTTLPWTLEANAKYYVKVDDGYEIYITDDSWNAEELKTTSFICNSGRWYLYTDKRWITESDDIYWPAYYQFSESGAVGAEPVVEWEHKGVLLPEWTHIESLDFLARADSIEVTDFEIRVVARYPTVQTRWQSWVDADAEMTNVNMYSGNFVEAWWTWDMADHRKKVIPINYTLTGDAMVSIYIKPVGTLTATRYLQSTHTYKIKK